MTRYEIDDRSKTTWPVDYGNDAEPEVEWMLRYGPARDLPVIRLQAASILGAYRSLVDPTISDAQAIDRLRRARRVAKKVAE